MIIYVPVGLASEQLSAAQMEQFFTVVKPGHLMPATTRDMLLHAYLAIGIDPKFVEIPVSRAAREVNGVHFNALAEASSRNQFPHMLRIPVPLGMRELKIFTLSPQMPRSGDLQTDKLVGYIKGDIEAQWWLGYQSARAVAAPSAYHLLLMLDAGRIDYAVAQADEFYSAVPASPIYRAISESVAVWRWQAFHYIHIAHADIAEQLSIELVRASKALQP